MDDENNVIISIRKNRESGRIFVVIADDNKDRNRRYLASDGNIKFSWGGNKDYFPSYNAALEAIQAQFVIIEETTLYEYLSATLASPED